MGMEIDPVELRAQAVLLNKAGDDLVAKVNTALSNLSDLGNFWGNDEWGEVFYPDTGGNPGYHTKHDIVPPDADAMVKGYHKIASGLEQMAGNIDVANWNSIVALPKVPE